MSEPLSFNIEREVAARTEAYCLLHNLPIRRKFTDAELETATARVQQALAAQQPLDLADLSPHVRVRDA